MIALKKFKEKNKKRTQRQQPRNLEAVIESINPVIGVERTINDSNGFYNVAV